MTQSEQITGTLEAFLMDAYSAVTDLRDELEEWKSNLPESKQNGQKADELEEAISHLGDCDNAPDVPESLINLKVVSSRILPSKSWGKSYLSRAKRLQNAINLMDSCIEALEDIESDEAKELAELIGSHRDEFEATEFPGAFG